MKRLKKCFVVNEIVLKYTQKNIDCKLCPFKIFWASLAFIFTCNQLYCYRKLNLTCVVWVRNITQSKIIAV